MAITEKGKGGRAVNACVVFILMTAAFIGGLLVDIDAQSPFDPNGNGNGNGHTTTTTTTTTTETQTTTTTTTPLPEPPIDTTYKLYLRVYYTNGLRFADLTQGVVILNDVLGNPDDTWNIISPANGSEMTGISLVQRHTRVDTVTKKLIIDVSSKDWNFEVTIGSSWIRTPEGIGDYLQTFTLSVTQSLECQLYLSPRWDGG